LLPRQDERITSLAVLICVEGLTLWEKPKNFKEKITNLEFSKIEAVG